MKQYRIAAAAVAVTLTLAACSSTSNGTGSPAGGGTGSTSSAPVTRQDNAALVPADLDTKVLDAVVAQKTFRLTGTTDDESGGTLGFDIHYASNGASGTMVIQGQDLQLLRVGSVTYMKGSTAFWQTVLSGQSTAAATAALVGGKWAKIPGSSADFKDLVSLLDAHAFLAQSVGGTSTVSKVGTTTFKGQQVVEFKDSSDGSHIYVQRYGAPLVLAVEAPAGSSNGGGSGTFTDYGKPYTVSSPTAAEVVDLTPYLK